MKMKNNSGFTVVELIAVMIGVFILLGFLIYTHNGVSLNNRNNQRESAVKQIQSQIERFYSQHGYYPSLKDLNNPNFRTKELPNLDPNILIDPTSKLNTSTVIVLRSAKPKYYSYEVTNSDGESCENDDTTCAKYVLSATYEGKVSGKKTYQRQNID